MKLINHQTSLTTIDRFEFSERTTQESKFTEPHPHQSTCCTSIHPYNYGSPQSEVP